MQCQQVDKLGKLAFCQSIHPLKATRFAEKMLIVGFDTEYDSRTRELLSLQLWHGESGYFFPCPEGYKLTWKELENHVVGFLTDCGVPMNKRHVSGIKLATWYSVAETQHIVDLKEAKVFMTFVGPDFVYCGSGRSIEIVDIMKWWNPPPSLAVAAEGFGLEKMKYDVTSVTRKTLKDPKFREYAIHDARLSHDIFLQLRTKYWEDFGVDIVLTRTSASTSATIYRLHYLKDNMEQRNVRIRRLALKANWGGRNECYWRGIRNGPIREYDAFSEYPSSVVALGILPSGDDWRPATLEDARGFARVRFRFPENIRFPCLPVFGQSKLLYPLEGESFCSFSEVSFALELGCDVTLVEGYSYDSGDDSLSRYMKDLLARRQSAKDDGDYVEYHAIKLAVNSLIGKFVQRVEDFDLNILLDLERLSGVPIHVLNRTENLEELAKAYGLGILRKLSTGAVFYPEWNTLILGYARAATSRALLQSGIEPIIASTDSVIGYGTGPEEFECADIRFTCRASGDRLQAVRTRLYLLTRRGLVVKMAHHAIHHRGAAERIFREWIPGEEVRMTYKVHHINAYRESLMYGKRYGEQTVKAMQASMGWDYKRRLGADGSTTPWRTVDEMIGFLP